MINNDNYDVMEIIDCYSYLDNIAHSLIDPNIKVFNEYHLSGSRLSGKTTSISLSPLAKAIVASIAYRKRIAIYVARKYYKSVPEMVKEIKYALENYNINYKYTGKSTLSAYPTFTFENESFIQVIGITDNKNTSNLKGTSKCYKFDISIDWCEEANEMSKKDFQDLRMSIRGAKKEIHITSCNPDLMTQPHIDFLHKQAPFDLNKLKAYGQQLTLLKDKSSAKLFHYTNYKVNPYLSADKIASLQQLERDDPVRAVPWCYGYPGSLGNTVFGDYLPRMRDKLDFHIANYNFGLDLGFSTAPTAHPTTLQIVGVNNERTRFMSVGEYYHDNLEGKRKDISVIYVEIVKYIHDFMKEKRISSYVEVNTDFGSGGLVSIDMLNTVVRNFANESKDMIDKQIYSRIRFIPVDKNVWYINDRVSACHILMSTGKWGANNDLTPHLLNQMSQMVYKEQLSRNTYKVEIKDYMDDCWDAFCYAIMGDLNKILNSNMIYKRGV